MKTKDQIRNLLREKKVIATEKRVLLIKALQASSMPLSVEELHKKVARHMNMTTVYRSLHELSHEGVVKKVHLQDTPARFELETHHHHHAVCISCGEIEDIQTCLPKQAYKEVMKETRKFKKITEHALEFFGTCISCSKH